MPESPTSWLDAVMHALEADDADELEALGEAEGDVDGPWHD